MNVFGKQDLIPQTEEDIHDIRWVNPVELNEYMKNSFPSVIDVLKLVSG